MQPFRERTDGRPECGVAMRRFAERLCCDACGGMFIAVADFAHAIDELVKIEQLIAFTHERVPAVEREVKADRPHPSDWLLRMPW
jgi:hypothetical protein